MRRTWAAAVCLSLGALGVAAPPLAPASADPAGGGGPTYRVHDYADGRAGYILPPGENGLVNTTDLLTWATTQKRPAGSDDQLGKYAGLLYGYPSLTDAGLSSYFDDESFGVPAGQVSRVERPTTGVTIYRDSHDVPHIYGQTDRAAAFGAGYAQAEDRLFLMDVLRHYGSGTLASFMGPSCEFEQMDHDQLLLAPYTEARAEAQYHRAIAAAGAQGRLAAQMVQGYVDGVNAYIDATRLDPSLLPADYLAALQPPQPWKVSDTVAIAGLIGGLFGRGGGFETADAGLRTFLVKKYGRTAGEKAYREVNHQDDPLAPMTIVDRRFDYDLPTASVRRSLTAIPDSTTLTGGPATTSPGCADASGQPSGGLDPATLSGLLGAVPGATQQVAQTVTQTVVDSIIQALAALPASMSNALVVDGSHTRSGHPIAVFGPQVSYFAPQILSLEEIQSPHYSAMGASFPGTGLVELGRGQDYAWSATSSMTDLIDQRVERLCSPGGGTPGARATSYLFRGRCLPMTHETYTETALTKAAGTGVPATISHQIYRTRHGVVQGWTTVHGAPVAIVNQRSTYGHDIDSMIGFLEYGEPGFVHGFRSFRRAAAKIDFTFNWFYVDDRHAGYAVSGRLPRRNPHADTSLPTWGTGGAEWRGWLPAREHPHELDPKRGYFVSWNNKPAPGVANDGEYHYGQTYRSQLLVSALRRQLRATHDKVTRADVVKAMETAASQDLDGLTVMPLLVKYAGERPQPAGVATMLATLKAWIAAGAHRRKATASATQYEDAAAVAISDELYDNLIRALYDPIFASGGVGGVASTGGAVAPGYDVVPMQWVNSPDSGGSHLGSAYDESGWESYAASTLQQLLGRHPADGFTGALRRHECGGGPSTCPAAIDSALQATYDALVAANGTTDVSAWTVSTAAKAAKQTMPEYDAIWHRALGIVGQPPIDWQNRPTFQQVVEFPRHR